MTALSLNFLCDFTFGIKKAGLIKNISKYIRSYIIKRELHL